MSGIVIHVSERIKERVGELLRTTDDGRLALSCQIILHASSGFLSWDCEDARMFTVMGLARDTTVSGVRRGWIVRLARGQRIAQVGRSVLGETSQDCQHESTRLRISTSDVDT